MALYDGLPYLEVVERVIVSELGKGSRTLEQISKDRVINGSSVNIHYLHVAADNLIREEKVLTNGETYRLVSEETVPA